MRTSLAIRYVDAPGEREKERYTYIIDAVVLLCWYRSMRDKEAAKGTWKVQEWGMVYGDMDVEVIWSNARY